MEKLEHSRHILLFEFNTGAKAVEAARNICAVNGYNVIGESTARKWFSRFKEDRFDTRSERPSAFDEGRLNTLIQNDPRQCTRELVNVMNCDHSKNRDICIQWACSRPKPQKSAGDHMCISACSSSVSL